MPGKKFYPSNKKTYSKKKQYAKKKYVSRKSVNFYKSKALYAKTNKVSAPFGNQMYTKLTYSANFAITQAAAAAPTAYTYLANSAYDPVVAVGGDSARFFTTLCGADNGKAPYREYRVMAVAVTCTFFNKTSATAAGNALVGVRFRLENQSALTTLDEMLTSRNASYKYIGPSDGNKGIVKIKAYKRMKDILGIKDMKDNDDTKATYNAQPATAGRVYLDVLSCAVDDTTTSSVSCVIKIKQYVQFLTPNTVESNEI